MAAPLPSRQPPGGNASGGRARYTAVLSAQERVQRDLARHSLVADLPPNPFPHSAPKPAREQAPSAPAHAHSDGGDGSLKAQHLTAMTAVLHRCMQQRDYARASRALGLLLRTDIHGRPIDIRAAGYWCMGAEILLRRDAHRRRQLQHNHRPLAEPTTPITRQGFADAKAFYETVIIQHPFHKSTPHSINALDFYPALFSLWIYVAQAEAAQQQKGLDAEQDADPSLDYSTRLQDTKRAQLLQASEIAERMDHCMSSAPFSSSQDLLRMRAMVALWQADLDDASHHRPAGPGLPDAQASALEAAHRSDYGRDAVEARRLASQILDRLHATAARASSEDDEMEYGYQ
ncbi:hypothetical protein DV736_g210, partial [Chaetothyriales sp. CBS 134916]